MPGFIVPRRVRVASPILYSSSHGISNAHDLRPVPSPLLSRYPPSTNVSTSMDNSAFVGIMRTVTNIINGRRLKKILDGQSESRPKAKPKKLKISKWKANKLTRKNQTNSCLLLLPSELRIQILEHVLGGQTWKIRFEVRFGKTSNQSRHVNALALLATCRQIHAETQLLPFRLGLFSALNCVGLYRWLSTIEPFQCAAITNIQAVCDFECTEECCLDGAIFAQQWCFSQLDSLKCIQIIARITNITRHLKRKVAASWVDKLKRTLKTHVQEQNKGVEVALARTYVLF